MKEAEVTSLSTEGIIPTKDDNKPPRRYKGIITRTHEAGYGFIISKEIKYRRIYFYWTALEPHGVKFEELKYGAEVEFESREYTDKHTGENKGLRAYNIKVISNENKEAYNRT